MRSQVAVAIGVYERVILFSSRWLVGLTCLSRFINCLNHLIHSLSGVGLDVINVVLSYSETSWFVVLAPVYLACLEYLRLAITHRETWVLFGDLLQHLNKLSVLSKFNCEGTASDCQFASHVDE